ncbi:MAG: hypothetical protein AAGE52_34320 [Myxococcota bacterium]
MIIPQDQLFRDEAERYQLRWNCEDCVLFNGEERCVHGFPTDRHRKERYRDLDASVLFCKEFDLA